MLCYQLHQQESGCNQEISESGTGAGLWKYCPKCGRPTGHIVVDKSEGQLDVPMDKAAACEITLRNVGLTPVNVDLELEAASTGIAFSTRQRRSDLPVIPRMPQQVELVLPPLTQSTTQIGALLIYAKDAALAEGEDPWQPRRTRALRLALSAEVDTPAEVSAMEQIALFREGIRERNITLVNSGRTRAEILGMVVPNGYDARIEGEKTFLNGQEQVRCRVMRRPGIQPAPESLLMIRTDGDKQPISIELRCEGANSIRALHAAIIGVDFGTTFSSIAFRACRYAVAKPDEVEFLLPEGESRKRLPTRVWIGFHGEMEFGERATRRHEQDPSQGFLFREIKTLLRSPEAAEIDPAERRTDGLRLVQKLFGETWGETLVTEYLRWFYQGRILPELQSRFGTTDIDVGYVFSLPVLDYNIEGQPQYELQHAAMTRCIKRAGFPYSEDPAQNQVDFEFEPVCAALGLLHPPAGVVTDTTGKHANEDAWPVLGSAGYPIREGDTVAVVDSGGGTTDVVRATVHEIVEDTGVRLELSIERCLGVSHEGETFGGELVSRQLLDVLNKGERPDQQTVPDEVKALIQEIYRTNDWYEGATDFEGLVASGTEERLIRREVAEQVKFILASDRELPVSRPDGGTTYIKPLLLSRLITPNLRSLSDALDRRVFNSEERRQTTYYLLVGGNTRLPFLRKWAQAVMNDRYGERLLALPEEYRQLAVAYGAAWVPDARVRNAVPYDLTVFAGPQKLLTLPRNQSQEIQPRSRQFALPPLARMLVRLEARLGTNDYCVGQRQIVNHSGNTSLVEIWSTLQHGKLRIDYRFFDPQHPEEKGTLESLLEYEL